ncbi:hypothetical protein D1007_24080 [Hordeum vulgare]|nr:hypothetical protein D1007_24080 [Hordeum vulgare]
MDLRMVYTDDPAVVENSKNTMERFLPADDKYKVLGLDLAHTGGRVGHDQKVFNSPDYRLAMVDATNDPKVLKTLSLASHKLVNIHDNYKTATTEAYTRYEMFGRTVDMRKCLLPKYNEGSSLK